MAGYGKVQGGHEICALHTMLVVGKVDLRLKGLREFAKQIRDAKYVTKVGFFPQAKYADGKQVAYIAYLNEYGDHNPPRPFMKRTAEKRQNAWTKLFGYTLKTEGVSGQSIYRAHKKVGIVAEGDIKKTIHEWSPTDPRPNKPATIRRKAKRARGGKNLVPINPETVLIDSGVMISSVTSEVYKA